MTFETVVAVPGEMPRFLEDGRARLRTELAREILLILVGPETIATNPHMLARRSYDIADKFLSEGECWGPVGRTETVAPKGPGAGR